MPQTVTKQNTFEEWRLITNEIIVELGTLTSLPTADKTTLVNAIIEVDNEITAIISDVGDLTALSTTTQVSLVDSLNELDTAIDALSTSTTALSNKIGTLANLSTTIQTDLVASINEVVSTKANKASSNFINRDENNGRFSADVGKILTTSVNSNYFAPINSATVNIVDKFIDDNTTNGGTFGDALAQNVIDLTTELTTAGRTELTFGYEFYILDITAGDGTLDGLQDNLINYYPICTSQDERVGRIGEQVTWQGWVRTSTAGKSILIGDANTTLTVDGTTQTAPFLISDTDNWVFVKMVKTLTKEYEKYFPAIRAEELTVTHIALSGIFDGDCDIGTHLGVV